MGWYSGRKNGGRASTGVRLPLARDDQLVIEEVGDELLIYDKTTNRAHCLTAPAARVWRACDGHTSRDALGEALDLDSETLAQVLDELAGNSLLQDTPEIGHTRREVAVRAAKLGAAASIPLTFVYSVVGPVPMAAATPTVAQCSFYSADACDTCGTVCGCCCACAGCRINSGGPPNTDGTGCHICYPTSLFPTIPAGQNGCGDAVSAPPVTVTSCSRSTSCSPAGTPPDCVPPCTPTIPLPTGSNCDNRFPSPC